MENNPLTLIVKEKTLGNLVTNARDIKSYVEERLKEYNVDNYNGDAKQAAKDKAELNNAAKTLNDRRIALEKEWNLPFQEFKDIVNDTCGLIKEASGKLDVIVKEQENREKSEKRASIEELWNNKKFNLVPLDRVFNPKWLNKTCKLSTVDFEIDEIIKRIEGDLASLDAFGEDTATLKDLYLSSLNLQTTLNKGAELKANRERLAEMEAQKKAEAEKAAAEKQVEETAEEQEEETEEAPAEDTYNVNFQTREVTKAEPAPAAEKAYKFCVYGKDNEVESVKAIAKEMGLAVVPSITLFGTVSEIAKFRELLSDNGLGYDKNNIINLEVKRV